MPTQGQNGFDRNDPLGCDLLWVDDLDAAHRLESGSSLVAHEIFWRWNCDLGKDLDDPDYGIDMVKELLARPLTPGELATYPRRLEAEARKDPRVATITVALEKTGPYAYKITAHGTIVNTGEPFALVTEVANAHARILEAA